MDFLKNCCSAINDFRKYLFEKHLILTLFVGGVLLISFGEYLSIINYSITIKNHLLQPGKILSNLGIAIVGTGFFTAITKSNYYTRFFQERVFDVFFAPSLHLDTEALKGRWKTLTHSLLDTTTGDLNKDITDEIFSRYFDKDSPYHYVDHIVTYEVELLADKKTLKIEHNVTCYVIINKNHKKAEISQKWLCSGDITLKSLFIDNCQQEHQNMFEEFEIDGQNGDVRDKFVKLTIPLENNNKPIFLERNYSFDQDFLKDPWLLVNNSKYIKNFVIKYKAKNCRIYLEQTGVINSPEHKLPSVIDDKGYTRVTIANNDSLTLPGQGYILLFTSDEV